MDRAAVGPAAGPAAGSAAGPTPGAGAAPGVVASEVARRFDAKIVLLSVKPQQMAAALNGLGQVMSDSTLMISIAAGISTAFIVRHLGQNKPWRVIRAMPNTPMLVGEGMVAICAGELATRVDLDTARGLFESAAEVIEVAEDQMNAVTAVSGSGPAYFFLLVEQMIQAATELGLSADHANQLARKTAAGAAKMLVHSSDSPQELRRKVTSPGGTTEAAINHMMRRDWPRVTIDAIKAAEARGRDLGQ